MRDALYILALFWRAARLSPVKWDVRRVFAVLHCGWRLYRGLRRMRRLERDIRRFSSSPRFF